MSKVVWITGASGFIGKNLLQKLPENYKIYKISQRFSNDVNTFLFNELYQDGGLSQLPLPNAVIHLGSISSPQQSYNTIKNNVNYTRILIEYLYRQKAVCNFVFASSINVYGEFESNEDSPTRPTTAYAASKTMCEQMLYYYGLSGCGINVSILRLAGVVGKYMTHGLIYDIVNKLKKDDKNLTLLGSNPGTSKSYIHVDDVVYEIWKCAEGFNTKIINNIAIKNQEYITALDVAKTICDIIGKKPNIQFSNNSFVGDINAPKILNSNTDNYEPMIFKDMTMVIKQGVFDYLCSI